MSTRTGRDGRENGGRVRRLRIFHVLKHANRGNGSVHVAVDLACEQAKQGHDVILLARQGPYTDLMTEHGVEVVALPERGGALGVLWTFLRLLAFSVRRRPQIIHAHMMSSAVFGKAISTVLPGTKLVTTVHNSFDGHSVLMRAGDVVVCVSEAEKRLLLQRGFREGRLRVVLNGTGGSARDALPLDPIGRLDQRSLIVVAGLHGRKGVDDVLKAFASTSASAPDWRLNIVGNGPDRALLEDLAATLGIADRVQFLGSTLTPKPLLEEAEIFVTGSLADPCPLAVIEARLAGCAIVGTEVGGIPEILDGGDAGLLVPPADPAAMSAALSILMQDDEALARARRSATDAGGFFEVGRVVEQYDEAYGAALQ